MIFSAPAFGGHVGAETGAGKPTPSSAVPPLVAQPARPHQPHIHMKFNEMFKWLQRWTPQTIQLDVCPPKS